MKIDLLLITIFSGLICCKPENKEVVMSEQATGVLDRNRTDHNPLTSKQIKEIERIHTAFSEVNSRSLDETIGDFKNDPNPDKKIAVWQKMAGAYERFTLNKHIEEYDKKYEAYQLILLRSTMPESDEMKNIATTYLTQNEIKEILGYYATMLRTEKYLTLPTNYMHEVR